VTFTEGSLVTSHGDSVLTGCKIRSADTAIGAPADCPAMCEAVAKTERRAKAAMRAPAAKDVPIISANRDSMT
jgi:hypothetical protein